MMSQSIKKITFSGQQHPFVVHRHNRRRRKISGSMRRFCVAVVVISGLMSASFQTELLFGIFTASEQELQRRRHIQPTIRSGGYYYDTPAETNAREFHLRRSVRAGVSSRVSIRRRSEKAMLVARDEFMAKTASPREIEEHFSFVSPPRPDLTNHFRSNVFSPFWQCHEAAAADAAAPDNSRPSSSKLVYLQMPRSGGSTVRAFLKGYATICHAGIAIVTQCLDLGWDSIVRDSTRWTNTAPQSPHFGAECALAALQERDGYRHALPNNISEAHPVTTRFLMDHRVDILAGHVPLKTPVTATDDGTAANATATATTTATTRYIVVLRDPLSRYVSQFLMPRWTANDTLDVVLANMDRHVTKRLETGRYRETLSNSLITPQQRYWAERNSVSWTYGRRVNCSKMNLSSRESSVVVGILERMPTSIRMIRRLLDGSSDGSSNNNGHRANKNQKITTMERLLGMPDNVMTQTLWNYSQPRTRSVVRAIRSNDTLRTTMDRYLQYEYEIYNYGLYLHGIQSELLV